MTDFLQEFQSAMLEKGFEPKDGKIVADDKWHAAYFRGDKKAWPTGTYSMKIVDGNFAIGCFFTRKDHDNKHKWHSKNGEKLTPEERKAFKKRIDEHNKSKERAEDKKQARIADRLTKFFKALPSVEEHPYLTKKGIKAHAIKHRIKGNELIIPCRGTDGKIWTVQRILADGSKFLFTGGRKRGSYFSFATSKEKLDIFILCEGYATGATIREATALPVIAAIDSGNLKPVIQALKAKYPSSRFIIAADNDQFTKNAKGEAWNVGIEKAKEAAASIGFAYVCWPEFSEAALADGEHRTDFNDLGKIAGIGEVTKQIRDFIAKIPAALNAGEVAVMDNAREDDVNQHHDGGDIIPPEAPPEADDRGEPVYDYEEIAKNLDPLKGDFDMNYKVLGYNQGTYYYFPFKERQIVALTSSAHSLNSLFRLDSLDNWMGKFGATETSEKKVVMYATNALMQLAKNRGVFKEEDSVRGCGAWIDAGRNVLHCGDVIYVDGVETRFDQLESEYTYIAEKKLLRPAEPLSNREAYALREICEAVTWENKLSGSLLAGWLVIAPVCGALGFRPHVYITGEAESGKSTVLDHIIKPVLGKMSINADGGTTEPAIRQMMGYDARPLVYDEAEKSIHMEGVLDLARKASTGGIVKKFGQGIMKVRFCACFSAINPPVNKTADESRIAFMVIKKNRRPTAMQEYNDLLALIEKTITPDYSNRMIARTLDNMGTLFANIKTFQKAARMVIGGARASQVIGTMLGGLFLLNSTKLVSLEDAKAWITDRDWTKHTIIDKETDPVRLLQYLSSCILRLNNSEGIKDYSIGDLIVMADDGNSGADKLLRYNGIAVSDKRVWFASRSASLEKMLKDTDWSNNPTRMLANIEGAEQFKIKYFSTGVKTSGVSIPLSVFLDRDDRAAPPPIQVKLIPDDESEIPF
jgi:putative DNA primase/helicase